MAYANVAYKATDGTTDVNVSTANPLPITAPTAIPVSGSALATTKSTTATTSQASITSGSATQILASNTNRLGAIVTNPGTTVVYIGQTNAVTATTGVALPGSGSLNIDSLPLYTGALFGITSTGSQTVTAVEFTA